MSGAYGNEMGALNALVGEVIKAAAGRVAEKALVGSEEELANAVRPAVIETVKKQVEEDRSWAMSRSIEKAIIDVATSVVKAHEERIAAKVAEAVEKALGAPDHAASSIAAKVHAEIGRLVQNAAQEAVKSAAHGR